MEKNPKRYPNKKLPVIQDGLFEKIAQMTEGSFSPTVVKDAIRQMYVPAPVSDS